MADPKQPQNTPESPDFDLDAALEEKFQQVRDDLTRFRQLDAADAAAQLNTGDMAPETMPTDPASAYGDPTAAFHAAGDLEPASTPAMPPSPAPAPQSEPDFDPIAALDAAPEQVLDLVEQNMGQGTASVPDAAPQAPADSTTKKSSETPKERRARHKQRRSMLITTRIGEVLRVFTIGIILIGGSIFLLVGARPTESAEENRMLATFPSFSWEALADGSYVEGVMHYYEDTVPGRSVFKQMISDFEVYQGLPSQDGVTFIGDVSLVGGQDNTVSAATPQQTPIDPTDPTDPTQPASESVDIATENTPTPTQAATEAPEPQIPADQVEVGDGIILLGDRAISVYGGGYSVGETYAGILNAYQQALGSQVQVYSMVAPTAVSFYLPAEYQSYTASEIDNINHINEYLEGVVPVDAYDALAAHTSEDIYARTDHHWLPLGAYYAAQAFAETADVPFGELSDYEAVTKSGYVGSMYTFTQKSTLRDNPEDFTYYIPPNDYTTTYYDTDFTNAHTGELLISLDNVEPVSWYLVFMGGDERITHISTDVDNNRTLVIIKDSYGNALVPCLTQSFSEIYVIDMRYFEGNAVSFMQEVGATDVLFAMNTFSATGNNCQHLETIRTQ